MKVHLLYPHQGPDPQRPLPPNHEDLIRDLELEVLLDAMSQGDQFLREVALHHLLWGLEDREVILYRQEILKDCLRLSPVVEEIYHTTLEFMERKSRWWYLSSTRHSNPSLVLSSSLHVLEIALDSLRALRSIGDHHSHAFQSRGFRRFFSMIQEELDDQYLAEVEHHINALKFPKGTLLSAQLGKGNQGSNYQLSKPHSPGENWLKRILTHRSPVYSFTVHPRDDHGLRVLADLRDTGLARVAAAVSRAARHVEGFFKALREEVAFYLGCINLHGELKPWGLPVAFPFPERQEKHCFSARGLYDISLALTVKSKVVGNDIEAHGKDLIIITGPNRGGKTTFLRSVGQAQLMMECGMFVPADSFTANLSSGVFTHFKREEDKGMKGGKLDKELERMSTVVDHLRPHALFLLNESFASTNDREGSEIAGQIIGALTEKGIKVFYVTHLFEFARSFFHRVREKVLFLRAERLPDGRRTFKLKEGKPLETSFGADLYRQIFQGEEELPEHSKKP